MVLVNKLQPHTDNWYFSWIIALLVFYKPLRTVIIVGGNLLQDGLGRWLSMMTIIPVALLLFLPIIQKVKIYRSSIILFCALLLSWIISFAFHAEFAGIYIEEAVDIFIMAFPFNVVITNIVDYSELKEVLYKSAHFTVVIMLGMYIIGKMIGGVFSDGLNYSQFYGIIISSASVVCLIEYFEKKTFIALVVFIVSCAMIVYFGARMPLACILIASILLVSDKIFFAKISYKKIRVSLNTIIISIISILLVCIIGAWIVNLRTQSMGVINPGQRIIYQITNGEFLQSKGRSAIWSAAVQYIWNHPFLGSGIIIDRFEISQSDIFMKYYGNLSDEWAGSYAHNLFLELMMQYGFLLGFVFCVLIVVIAMYIYVGATDENRRRVVILVIAETFGILLLSGPTFSWPWFWIMLGMTEKVLGR